MDAAIIIGDSVFASRSGLLRLEIVDEYGFVASTVNADLLLRKVMAGAPGVLMHRENEKELATARIVLPNGIVRFAGYLDDVGGSLQKFEPPQTQVSISGRSVLSVLLDESEENKFTTSYVDTDWAKVVYDLVEKLGFTPKISSTGVLAGDKTADGHNLLVIDGETAGNVIEQAIEATGFVANANADMCFYFCEYYQPEDYTPLTFTFLQDRADGDIESAPFSNGRIESFTIQRNIRKVDPGCEVSIVVPKYPELGGKYYVTRSRYVADFQGAPDFAEFNVAPELPKLKSESEA